MTLLIDGINLQISGKSVQSFKTSYQTTVHIKSHTEKQHEPGSFKQTQKVRKHMQ